MPASSVDRGALTAAVQKLEARGVCILCGIDVAKRPLVRAYLTLVLKTDPTADPAVLRSMDETTFNQLLGPVCGPFSHRSKRVSAHYHCLLWSPDVDVRSGGLMGVAKAITRGMSLKCHFCGRRGATLGCFNARCRRSYHLPCARLAGHGVCDIVPVADPRDRDSFTLPGGPLPLGVAKRAGGHDPGGDAGSREESGRYKLFCPKHVVAPSS